MIKKCILTDEELEKTEAERKARKAAEREAPAQAGADQTDDGQEIGLDFTKVTASDYALLYDSDDLDELAARPISEQEYIIEAAAKAAAQLGEIVRQYTESDAYKQGAEKFNRELSNFYEENSAQFQLLKVDFDELRALTKWIGEEVKQDKKTAAPPLDTDENIAYWCGLLERARAAKEKDDRESAEYEEKLKAIFESIERGREIGTERKNELSAMPIINAISPKQHIIPNNALMNKLLTHEVINTGAFNLLVSNARGRRHEIVNYTLVEYNSTPALTTAHLSEYERLVSDSIISLYEQARSDNLPPVFTIDTIFRAMPGSGEKASPQQRGAITRAIEKLRALHIHVDATTEMRARKVIGETETLIYDDYYFSMTRATYRNCGGGGNVTAYKLNTEPIILSYAKTENNQIITVPAKCLDLRKVDTHGKLTPNAISLTIERQEIFGYILRQIAWIKHDKAKKVAKPRNNIISYSAIFNAADIDTAQKQTIRRHRDFIGQVLNYEQAIGYIKEYKTIMEGRTYYGIEIIV